MKVICYCGVIIVINNHTEINVLFEVIANIVSNNLFTKICHGTPKVGGDMTIPYYVKYHCLGMNPERCQTKKLGFLQELNGKGQSVY